MSIAPLHAFREATGASARIIERDGRRIGYVHVWASVGQESVQALSGALGTLGVTPPGVVVGLIYPKNPAIHSVRPPERRGVDGVIIDMRGRIGGYMGTAGRYLEILDPRGPYLSSSGSHRPSLRGRTAVLIDRRTRSTAELFVSAYKRERLGPLIGTRTAGAVSGAGAWVMPGGNVLTLAVSGFKVDGEVLEGPGIAADIEVARPIPYAAGADPVLEAALDHLARVPPQPSQPAPEPLRGQW
jgi:carboxyl-terminal processing protease